MTIDLRAALAATGEPTRARILELLADGPRTVGEVARDLGARQPQTTKHLQTLEAAGLIRVRRLGRRRIVGLDRAGMRSVAEYFATLAEASGSVADDEALDRYERGLAVEVARLAAGGHHRTLDFVRALAAPAPVVWEAWTDATVATQWWAPHHFTVDEYRLDPTPGGTVRVVLREGDGTTYTSTGHVVAVRRGRRLEFDLSPVDATGEPYFAARHTLTLDPARGRTTLALTIEATATRPEAAPTMAGLEPGWEQLLDQLDEVTRTSGTR